jgi:hypothetical protein
VRNPPDQMGFPHTPGTENQHHLVPPDKSFNPSFQAPFDLQLNAFKGKIKEFCQLTDNFHPNFVS